MHKYLRAIGISETLNRKDMNRLLDEISANPSKTNVVEISDSYIYCEKKKYFTKNAGITIYGELIDDDEFVREYYIPFFEGSLVSTTEDIYVEKSSDREAYYGSCDDVKVGVNLIFYLQNLTDFLKYGKVEQNIHANTIMSALSISGKIILPMNKDAEQKKREKLLSSKRNALITKAREGDEEAIESLTLEDIDIYGKLSKRIMYEDILSIVDTYFMPYGIESDKYSVLAEIEDFSKETNSLTGDVLYHMQLNSNDLIFNLCINEKDLLGVPEIGRRFKGDIWMQGQVHFPI